jgi:HEPN domain-containing protein
MSPPSRRQPASPEEWLLHAGSDLNLARLGRQGDVLPEQVCFHAQQAVEKALKAVLIYSCVDFPFTHDLEELLDTLSEAGISVPTELEEIGALTPYAVETRYPGYWGEITSTDVNDALEAAERTLAWAKATVKGASNGA